MDDKNYSVPPGYTVVGGSTEEGFLTLQSPFGSQYTVSFTDNNCDLVDRPTSPFETDFGNFF